MGSVFAAKFSTCRTNRFDAKRALSNLIFNRKKPLT